MNLPKIAKFTRLHPDCSLQRVNLNLLLFYICCAETLYVCDFKFYVEFKIPNMRRSRSLNNADVVRTASVARVGVGKGAGAPRNSERRPLTYYT